MKTELINIRDTQQNSWNTFSNGWKKWDDFTMQFLNEQGVGIVEALDLSPTDKVLDIACGTGEPGLTIAGSIMQGGSVTAIDLSEGMLNIAKMKAGERSIDNFQTLVADACELPFEDATFDAVSCRLGFMFFPDMKLAASEMIRVLKPGGRIVVTVWAEPDKNRWITAMVGALKKHTDMPAPDPNGPGLFRCATPGFMPSLFSDLGISGESESDIYGVMNCDSADEYWEFMNDVVPPVVMSLKNASEDTRANVKGEIIALFEEITTGNSQSLPYGARLFSATKS